MNAYVWIPGYEDHLQFALVLKLSKTVMFLRKYIVYATVCAFQIIAR